MTSAPPIKVAVVEDDDEIRANLVSLLNQSSHIRCISSHRTAEDAISDIPRVKPDVVLMDIHLPRMSGIECVRKLKPLNPALQILMLTVYEDSDKIFQSLVAGASGYLLKRMSKEQIIEAIEDVQRGGSPMNSHIARKVVQYFNQLTPPPDLEQLSAREQQVLECLVKGLFYKEIADALSISIDTVRKHLKSIYEKLHVHSRTEAVVKYLRH